MSAAFSDNGSAKRARVAGPEAHGDHATRQDQRQWNQGGTFFIGSQAYFIFDDRSGTVWP